MSYQHNFPTILKDVEPGDKTGDYYVTFGNLQFKSTWRELKDWLSEYCTVDFVEVFPLSSSGWIRLQGKDNFEKALAHIHSEPFKGRPLIVDARNKTETVKIKIKESSPNPRYGRGKWRLARCNRGRRMPPKGYGPPALSPYGNPIYNQAPLQGSVSTPRRRRSLPESEGGATDAAEAAEVMAYNDFLALSDRLFGMNLHGALHGTLPMPYYAPPFAFPSCEGGYYNNMNACAGFPFFYGGGPMPCHTLSGVPLAENAQDGVQRWVDKPEGRERRSQSLPPSARVGNETIV
ncbi:hypothetical protein Trco_005815 [Trichoderma cornu-damae]|uniref:RRM domain-containing protein n=1 Tax=Trichoderma cornu-damae TaxID=654480 RepID=A0A9P8QQA0_9HYPO|nr:hypothetical protein Trco_005815 [Trichoderma cornu-damae]